MRKILILFFLCGNAFASDWHSISENPEISVSVDKQSISTSGSWRKAWVSYTYGSPLKVSDYTTKTYQSIKNLSAFNCQDRTSASMQSVLYSGQYGNGDSVSSYVVPKNKLDFSDVVPDTHGEAILNFVCTYPIRQPKQKPSDFKY
jgi:hypothetical protein